MEAMVATDDLRTAPPSARPRRGRRTWTALVAAAATAALTIAPLTPTHAAPDEDLPPRVEERLAQDENLSHLGTPVNSQIGSPSITQDDNGRWMSYQVFKGVAGSEAPATFVAVDVETGETVQTCLLPDSEGVRNFDRSSDGKIYWATYYDFHLWQYDPATSTCNDLGDINPDETLDHAFGLTAGPDGTMFIGTYPDSRLHVYDPATDQIETIGTVHAPDGYIHGMSYDEASDSLIVATGAAAPTIWKIPNGGTDIDNKVLIADGTTVPGLDDTDFVQRLDVVADRIVALSSSRLLILDLDGKVEYWENTKNAMGYRVIPGPTETTFLYSANGGMLTLYDTATQEFTETGIDLDVYLSSGEVVDQDGTMMIQGTDASGVFTGNLETGEFTRHPIEFRQPTLIQKLFHGPDDSIWASGYMQGLAIVDPSGEQHGDTLNVGQYESAVVRDGKLYIAHYGNARVSVIDPETFDPADPSTVKLLFDGVAEGQDRPFGMAYNPDRDEIYVGSVAGYGKTQGGMAVYDPVTDEHTWLTDDLAVDQNVVSIAYNPVDQMVYIGTTLDGGLGSTPSDQTAGKLLVWDPETQEVVKEIDPIEGGREGISGLIVGDDGRVWGVAEEALFVYDPETGESTRTATVAGRYTEGTTYWAWAYLHHSAQDGMIYGTAGSRFFRIDPSTGESEQIGTGFAWSTVDDTGDVYLSSGADLYKYTVPQAVTGTDRDQKCLAVRSLQDGRQLDTSGLIRGEQSFYDKLTGRVADGKGPALEAAWCD